MPNEEPRDRGELKQQADTPQPPSSDGRELADDEIESVSGGSGPGDEGPEENKQRLFRR